MRLVLGDGKYTYVLENGDQYALRYGEFWQDLTGDKFVMLLAEMASTSINTGNQHPDTAELVVSFATALAKKLELAEAKYGYGNNWKQNDWMDECRYMLIEHLKKGDPLDVAAYCAFLWFHNEPTVSK